MAEIKAPRGGRSRFEPHPLSRILELMPDALHRCGRCLDARWICEEHLVMPWPHHACAGPGVPCPDCNQGEPPDMPDGFISFIRIDADNGPRH